MSKGSPLAVVLLWKYSPYQDAVPTWYAFDFGLLVFRVLDTLVAMTGGFVTMAASRLLGLDAAPAPRLATDKTTARPSAKRRRIQIPLVVEVVTLVVCSFGQTIVKCYPSGHGLSIRKPAIKLTK